MIEPTVKDHQTDLSLLMESMKSDMMVGPGFSESPSLVNGPLIYFGVPTKTWLMQRLLMGALTQNKELPVYVCIDAD